MGSSSCPVRGMYPELMEAAKVGNTEKLYELVCHNLKIWDEIDAIPFADTPLHMVASFGDNEQTESSQHQKRAGFAIEMAILKPSFTRKLDPQGHTPMHLALLHKAWTTVRALMTHDPELVRVKAKGGKTPLHVAAEEAPPQLLAELLLVCPSSVEDVTAQWQTAVHVAVEAKKLDSFKVLLGWLFSVRKEDLLTWKDIDGNTVLHLATLENQVEVVKRLLNLIEDDVENFKGQKAITIYEKKDEDRRNISEEIGGLLSRKKQGPVAKFIRCCQLCTLVMRRFLLGTLETGAELVMYCLGTYSAVSSKSEQPAAQIVCRKMTNFFGKVRAINTKSRKAVMLTAALVATATYQGILSPPGGFWQDNSSSSSGSNASDITTPHSAGKMITNGKLADNFISFNTMAFVVSICLLVASMSVDTLFGFYSLIAMIPFLCTYGSAVHSIIPHGTTRSERIAVDGLIGVAIIWTVICFTWRLYAALFSGVRPELTKAEKRRIWPLLKPVKDNDGQGNNPIDHGDNGHDGPEDP